MQRTTTPKVAKQVAKQTAGTKKLTGARGFENRVFKAGWTRGGETFEASEYSIRVSHDRERRTVCLQTGDLREAARRAARLETVLRASGWDAALATLGPEPARIRVTKQSPTVGDVIETATRLFAGRTERTLKPATLQGYAVALRWVAALAAGIPGGREKYDYKGGGRERWRERVDAIPLANLTPDAVKRAVSGWVAERAVDEPSKRRAIRSASSLQRQARGFWSSAMAEVMDVASFPNPFAGRVLRQPAPEKFNPQFSGAELVAKAREQLREADPEGWKAFLLALAAGLRRGEVDRLRWADLDLENAVVRVVGEAKADSVGVVPISPAVVEGLAEVKRTAVGDFVLVGDPVRPKTKTASMRRTYRANGTFVRLVRWLRENGVSEGMPLHALRKECGSLIHQAGGVHNASLFLRHKSLAVTSAHYLDGRGLRAVDLFEPTKGET